MRNAETSFVPSIVARTKPYARIGFAGSFATWTSIGARRVAGSSDGTSVMSFPLTWRSRYATFTVAPTFTSDASSSPKLALRRSREVSSMWMSAAPGATTPPAAVGAFVTIPLNGARMV